MFSIQTFQKCAKGYEKLVALHNAVWADTPVSLHDWKHFQTSAPAGTQFCETIAQRDGQLVGYISHFTPWWWTQAEARVFFEILVHPNHRRAGIGSALYRVMDQALGQRPLRSLHTKTREDQAGALAFLRGLGFEQVMRTARSQLRLDEIDLDRFAPLWRKLEGEGVCLTSMDALRRTDPDWKLKLHELRCEISRDVPSPEVREVETYARFEQRFLKHPELLPEANFIAVEDERYVGYSNLWSCPDPKRLNTGLSGVVRGHRRRGICTALKARGFAYAKARGVTALDTDNEENNPMYALNLKLGFKPLPAELDFRKAHGASNPF